MLLRYEDRFKYISFQGLNGVEAHLLLCQYILFKSHLKFRVNRQRA